MYSLALPTIRLVLFKEYTPTTGKEMRTSTTLYIQRTAESRGDDIVQISPSDDYVDMFMIRYSTPELKKKRVFYMTRSKVLAYVSDLLKSLTHDIEPFEAVQVSTSIHPSVVYHVADLDDVDVRRLIEDMVDMSMRNVYTV
jgi:hypothetical protein